MGFMSVNKPKGLTSHDVVERVRRFLKIRRVGHGGTLDPIATGVLPIAVGELTRFFEYIPDRTKIYLAEFTFGIETDTLDMDGTINASMDCPQVTSKLVENILSSFLGNQKQVPPLVSAKHYKGKRLYKLARKGEVIEVPPKDVTINLFELIKFTEGPNPKGLFKIQCSEGTYVRALARDVGKALGVPSVLSWLERTRSGPFKLDSSLTLEEIETRLLAAVPNELFLPIEDVLPLPRVSLGSKDLYRILNGNQINLSKRILPYEFGTKVLIYDLDCRCHGIGVVKGCVTAGFVSMHPLKIISRGANLQEKQVNV